MKNLIHKLILVLSISSSFAQETNNPILPSVSGQNNPVIIISNPGIAGAYSGGVGAGVAYPPMGGGYGSGLGGYPGGFGGSGYSTNQGGLNGAVTNMDKTSCPFLQKDADVSALWNSTKDTLKQISDKKESGACTLVQSNSATLQRAMENFERQKFRSLGGASTAYASYGSYLSGEIQPNCENYEDLYQNEYEQMLSLVTRNYPMSAMPGDYLSACGKFYPTNTDNFTYSDAFKNCLGDSLAKKIEISHIECKGKSKYLDKIENQKASFKAQQEALLQINSAISQLTKNISQCDNKDLVQSSIKSIISIGSTISSPAIGGVGGVAAAFGGDIINNIVNLLYNGSVKKDWAEMDKEDRYNMNACLFYQSQKLRCNMDQSTEASPYINASCSVSSLNPVGQEALAFSREVLQITSFNPDNIKMTKLIEFLGKPEDDMAPIDFLSTTVLNGLKDKSMYSEMAIVEKFLQGYKEVKTIRDGISSGSIKASQMIPTVSLEQSPGSTQPAYKVLEGLEKEMLELDMQTVLSIFIQSQNGDNVSTLAQYHEYSKMISKQFQEMQQKAMFDWNNLRTVDMATTALVNNLKDQFEDRLKVHFNTDLKTAMAFEKENKSKAFDSLSGLINDCLYTEGMHAMGKSDLKDEARSTAKISTPSIFKKYCGKLQCASSGAPPYNYAKTTPESFRQYQCSSIYNSPYSVMVMKSNFLRDGKICGYTLADIFKAGN